MRSTLLLVEWKREEHRVAGRETQLGERAPITGAELLRGPEEERNVRTEPGGHLPKSVGVERVPEQRVPEPERGRRIGAATAETRGDRERAS